jgi:4-hydroxybenzoate polyprenyltransferase
MNALAPESSPDLPVGSSVEHSAQSNASRPLRRRKLSQERVMVMFVLFFALGILLLVLLPEGHAARGLVMTIYSLAVFWTMFRFGI